VPSSVIRHDDPPTNRFPTDQPCWATHGCRLHALTALAERAAQGAEPEDHEAREEHTEREWKSWRHPSKVGVPEVRNASEQRVAEDEESRGREDCADSDTELDPERCTRIVTRVWSMEVVEVPTDGDPVIEGLHIDVRVDLIDKLSATTSIEFGNDPGKLVRKGGIGADRPVDHQSHFALRGRIAGIVSEPVDVSFAEAAGHNGDEPVEERVDGTIDLAPPSAQERRDEIADDQATIYRHMVMYHAAGDLSTAWIRSLDPP
jgi:hypothetical protein